MRATLITACAGLLFATGAQAQDAVKACRQLKDEAERLKCYDRLDTSASNAPRGQRESKPDGETGWIVNDEKSPLDDSPLVSAALTSGVIPEILAATALIRSAVLRFRRKARMGRVMEVPRLNSHPRSAAKRFSRRIAPRVIR